MRVTGEEKDIVPGRRYGRDGLSETLQIGFLASEDSAARYVSVSNSDGMVTAPRTKSDLAEALTNERYVPVELLTSR